MVRWISVVPLLILTTFPVASQESPQALQDAFIAAIEAGDADAVAALYSEDAVNYAVGSMAVRGPDGVRADWAPFFEANEVTELAVVDGHEEVLGDTAVAWGLWRMTFVPKEGGEAVTMEGRFMDMSKYIGGRWRYVVDHASVPLPPAEQ